MFLAFEYHSILPSDSLDLEFMGPVITLGNQRNLRMVCICAMQRSCVAYMNTDKFPGQVVMSLEQRCNAIFLPSKAVPAGFQPAYVPPAKVEMNIGSCISIAAVNMMISIAIG